MSEEKLKPCPFCGDIPTLTYRMDVGDKELFHDCHVLEDCIDVLEPDAAKRWNTRFQPAENCNYKDVER